MAVPTLTPKQEASVVVLTATGSLTTATTMANYPFAIYANTGSQLYDANFISGAIDQVSYTYKKLGGDVLDIELKVGNIYAAYEEAVLEYSYLMNVHQSKNVLSDMLGNTTGSFDHHGILQAGTLSSSLGTSGQPDVSLKYPKFKFEYSNRIGDAMARETGIGSSTTIHSASFTTKQDTQDYDLQNILANDSNFSDSIGNKKVTIRKVFYKTPEAMWRFYGYYGGLNTIGNLLNYGQYSDDSSFQIIPIWQNKLQAKSYESHIYTRTSHYSYELKNNILRLFPIPDGRTPDTFWFEFTIKEDAWEETSDRQRGADGVNNMGTIPFGNIPYKSINAIGKQWIRRFALALTKEMLGQVRGKFSTVPIPGESVTLNHSELLSQAKEEQQGLREEFKTILDELTYVKLAEKDATTIESVTKIQERIPLPILIG